MAVTIKTITSTPTDYEIISEAKSFMVGFSLEKTRLGDPKESLRSFYSDSPKVFLKFPRSFYHCMYDFMGTVFHLYELDKDILFIIDSEEAKRSPSSKKSVDFCISVLNYHGIKHEEVNLRGVKEINIDNFYIKGSNHLDHNASNSVFNYFLPFIKDKDIKPSKNVYISRSYINQIKKKFYGDGLNSRLSRQEYSRIKNEDSLENYFVEHGFEIVIPENFETFEDQLNFFYQVKTAVAVTGGGLTNTMFMQEGGTVVELMTTLITETNASKQQGKSLEFEEAQHHFYHSIAFNKKHTYVGIRNLDTNADKLIEEFQTNKVLKAILD